MNPNNQIKVFAVEDDPFVKEAIHMRLEQDSRTTVWGNVEPVPVFPAEAISKLEEELQAGRELPDVILLDMFYRFDNKQVLKGPDVIDKIREIRATLVDLDTKILCLSQDIDPELVVSALDAGADGYLDKHQGVTGWAHAIVLVHEGKYVLSPSIAEWVTFRERFSHISQVEIFQPEDIPLGVQARNVAFLYFQARLKAREIATRLGIAESTVRYHIGRIRKSKYMFIVLGRKP